MAKAVARRKADCFDQEENDEDDENYHKGDVDDVHRSGWQAWAILHLWPWRREGPQAYGTLTGDQDGDEDHDDHDDHDDADDHDGDGDGGKDDDGDNDDAGDGDDNDGRCTLGCSVVPLDGPSWQVPSTSRPTITPWLLNHLAHPYSIPIPRKQTYPYSIPITFPSCTLHSALHVHLYSIPIPNKQSHHTQS